MASGDVHPVSFKVFDDSALLDSEHAFALPGQSVPANLASMNCIANVIRAAIQDLGGLGDAQQ